MGRARAPAGPHVGVGRQVEPLALALAVLARGWGGSDRHRGANGWAVAGGWTGSGQTCSYCSRRAAGQPALGWQDMQPGTASHPVPPLAPRRLTLRHRPRHVSIHILLALAQLLRHVLEHSRGHLHACQGRGRWWATRGEERWLTRIQGWLDTQPGYHSGSGSSVERGACSPGHQGGRELAGPAAGGWHNRAVQAAHPLRGARRCWWPAAPGPAQTGPACPAGVGGGEAGEMREAVPGRVSAGKGSRMRRGQAPARWGPDDARRRTPAGGPQRLRPAPTCFTSPSRRLIMCRRSSCGAWRRLGCSCK